MARNRIQFQKGLSEAQFQALYGDEPKVRGSEETCKLILTGSHSASIGA